MHGRHAAGEAPNKAVDIHAGYYFVELLQFGVDGAQYGLEYVADVLGDLDHCCWEWLVNLFLFLETLLYRLIKQRNQQLHLLTRQILPPLLPSSLLLRKKPLNPTPHIQPPPQILKRQIHHPTATHRRRTRHRQILHLKQHPQLLPQLNPLTIRQTQRHVIIQHGVHVFDP